MIFGELALISAAGFSGAAIYVNVAEQPARRALEVPALLAEWKLSYKRGFAMQAPLAVVGCIFGLLAWRQIGDLAFIAEAVLIIANWPWTLLGIKPTNNALMGMDAGAHPGAYRQMGQASRRAFRPRHRRSLSQTSRLSDGTRDAARAKRRVSAASAIFRGTERSNPASSACVADASHRT